MNILYITVGVGPRYAQLARYQARCMAKHGWESQHIAICPEEGSHRGREEKCGFAHWIPDSHHGPVVLLDADCLIRGPEPAWTLTADVYGVALYAGHGFAGAPLLPCGRLDAMCLVFRNEIVARRVSERWLSAWIAGCGKMNAWSDTYALQFALDGEDCAALPGATGSWPHPSIHHRYTEAGG